MRDKSPGIVSVILNTNRKDDTLECLRSLQASSYKNHEVIVLDNASTDGSAEMVQREFPWVILVASPENVGFARGNNVALSRASGE